MDEAEFTIETAYTARFSGFVVLFAVLVALGLVTLHPAAIAGGALLLVFLGMGLVTTPTQPADALAVSYDVTPAQPRPADIVTVEVTVTNQRDQTFTDIRLVDLVPADLQVVDGQARATGPLRAGESLSFSYEIVAKRGEYDPGPVIARSRTLLGSMYAQAPLPIESAAPIRCAVTAGDIPLSEQATDRIGRLVADSGGDGVEFYATREYHHGDPPTRINWREYAKRDELSTITYRQQQAACVTVIVDTRAQAMATAGPGNPTGDELAVYGAFQIVDAMQRAGHTVGVTLPGLDPASQTRATGFPFRRFEHGGGDEHTRRLLSVLDELEQAPASNQSTAGRLDRLETETNLRTGADEETRLDPERFVTIESFTQNLQAWCPPNTQYICVTPLLDDAIHGLCTHLSLRDVPVTVVSPDVTVPVGRAMDTGHSMPSDGGEWLSGTATRDTAARHPAPATLRQRHIQRLQRATRIEALRNAGCTVIDWDPSEPLAVSVEEQTLPGV